MDQQKNPHAKPPGGRVERALDLNEKVVQDLEVVGAEMHLTNTVLDQHLPDNTSPEEVRRALTHNARLEEKVQDATTELAEATKLLDQEVAERKRLERELASAKRSSPA